MPIVRDNVDAFSLHPVYAVVAALRGREAVDAVIEELSTVVDGDEMGDAGPRIRELLPGG